MSFIKNNLYIIAEAGSNWLTYSDCLNSIVEAKIAGADAVKFQAYNASALYGVNLGHPGYISDYIGNKHPSIQSAWKTSMQIEWLPLLKRHSDTVGIDFMCSAFSEELIDAVDPFVDVHKLASSEMCHVKMLERLRQIGKPVIMSTGAQTEGDIGHALEILGPVPVTLMYCVAAYPALEVDLGCIDLLRSKFNCPVGYSDHSTDVLTIPYHSVHTHGAVVLEKHFSAIDQETPDSGHSLRPDQFRKMVAHIKGYYKSRIGQSPQENKMITTHKRRLKATSDIKAGDLFVYGVNFGIFRSLEEDISAMHPFMCDQVNGKISKKDIKAGEGISPDAL